MIRPWINFALGTCFGAVCTLIVYIIANRRRFR